MALATSSPLRMPPLAITSTPAPRNAPTAAAVGMPQSANSSPRSRPAVSARSASTLTHDVPPAPETSMVRTPTSRRRCATLARDAAAGLLGDHRDRQLAHQAGEGGEAAAEVAVAARLDQLLRRVEVDADGVGADPAHQLLDLRRPEGGGLHEAEVGEHQRRRRMRAHRERVLELGRPLHGALRAEPEGDAVLLGHPRQRLVDVGGLARCRRSCR